MDERSRIPRVSIGLPVYNGERYLAEAIRSILEQDFTDLELIISDNASSDRTPAICEEFARRDPRVRYLRNPRNFGAARNYNQCFQHARGTYFKWAAHDDALAPGFLSKAVAALDARPEAVLCTVGITEIDGEGQVLRRYANHFPDIDSPNPARRFGAAIHTRHQCEDFFGLFRREALLGTGLHGAYNGSDRVLLAEMALRGPWVQVPEPLFLHREHDNRYTRAILLKDRREASLWQDTSQPAARASEKFFLLIYRQYWRLVQETAKSAPERLGCYAELGRWWFTDGHFADVVLEVLQPWPGVIARVRALKHWLVGQGHDVAPGSLPQR